MSGSPRLRVWAEVVRRRPLVITTVVWLSLSTAGLWRYRGVMRSADSDLHSRIEELYASAREARGRAQETACRAWATQLKFQAAVQRHQQAWATSERLRELRLSGQRDRLAYSAYARLQARMASLPVIEQAKGIIMAQCGWSADQAFDTLRKASQRENIKVRDLAARIVAATAQAPLPGASGSAPWQPASQGAGDDPAGVVQISKARRHGRSVSG